MTLNVLALLFFRTRSLNGKVRQSIGLRRFILTYHCTTEASSTNGNKIVRVTLEKQEKVSVSISLNPSRLLDGQLCDLRGSFIRGLRQRRTAG